MVKLVEQVYNENFKLAESRELKNDAAIKELKILSEDKNIIGLDNTNNLLKLEKNN